MIDLNIFARTCRNDYGLNAIPATKDKRPNLLSWKSYQNKAFNDFDNCDFQKIGFICGRISGNLEVIDMDNKYDLSGRLFNNYKTLVEVNSKELWEKLVIEKTISGGFHFFYRCSEIEGSLKLASRHTTDEERKENPHEKTKVLIETRGEGGFIVVAPSEGYELIQGDFSKIPEITPEERDILFTAARALNESDKELFKPAPTQVEWVIKKGITPWQDYDQRGDAKAILNSNGWRIVYSRNNKTVYRRPGNTHAKTSGVYNEDTRIFVSYSSSTEFEPEKGYTPSAVYATLTCNGDFSEAGRQLYKMGYGDRIEKIERVKNDLEREPEKDDFSFISSHEDEEDYLHKVRTGSLELGLTTGFETLDPHFVLKQGCLDLYNAFDNVGKSTVLWYFALCSAIFHGWNWVFYSSENKCAQIRRKLIEFYLGKNIDKRYSGCTDKEFEEARKFVNEHFILIKNTSVDGESADSICKKFERCMKLKTINAVLIDPYNGLNVDGKNEYSYHKMSLGKLRKFCDINNVMMAICTHAYTKASRQTDDMGRQKPPMKGDIEFGQLMNAKTDNQLTFHRYINDENEYKNTHVYVNKIKDTDTGGKVTPYDKPVQIRLDNKNGWYGFWEYRNDGTFHCPLKDYFDEKTQTDEIEKTKAEQIDFSEGMESFTHYGEDNTTVTNNTGAPWDDIGDEACPF